MIYTPQKISSDLALFAVKIKRCPVCTKDMVVKPKSQFFETTTFPTFIKNNFKSQSERAGFVYQSHIKVDDEYICEECVSKGKATILCFLCKEIKDASKEKESYGDPPEFLCLDCYENVSAKKWEDTCNHLSEVHRYDFD